ncbi:MAG: bifunctional phosphopantothenoylcysteine decarboxylase/phosphopantothenate--cysteine ligase CoaBC [Actinomycetota bacterium]|nr:bifunctional phosphopantothenoylcysteine decarboxylase/phosphopantothenate--cysteine ligase CoaBC [Actinomycetota bacterium]
MATENGQDSSGTKRTVLVGVTGCIAAYKSCELVRELVRSDARVKVVMTEAATNFVGPLTMRALTNEPVAASLWDDPGSAPVHHISLAQEADVFVIAPCTANVIAKIAHGRADDILTTTALATEATLVIAPAMNTHMWRAEATQANIETLRARGAVIVGPDSGDLACGDVGEGRLAPTAEIAEVVRAELLRTEDLEGASVLVTAGPTFEPIDGVRFLGNRSSGKTGYAIAEEAARRGAKVTLVSGPTVLPDPFGVTTFRVTTALEMRDAVSSAYSGVDIVIATAAVSDFRAEAPAAGKLKKGAVPGEVRLVPNPDILAELGADKGNRVLVGFAAETEDVLGYARTKLAEKNLDMIVANDVSAPGLGFGSDVNRVTIVDHEHAEELPVLGKRAIARELLDRVAAVYGRRGRPGGEERT